jgi:hypothetical protein
MTENTQYAVLSRQVAGAQKNVVLLSPTRVSRMIKARQQAQVVKFRSTCSDCVPNL